MGEASAPRLLQRTVQPLPACVQEDIRSGVGVTSTAHCIRELMRNALDSGAGCVAVRVNLPPMEVQVVDNGCGMTDHQLRSIGRRYTTSRGGGGRPSGSRFGYRGEALASIARVCRQLEIVSRARHSEETWRRLLTKDDANDELTKATQRRPSVGTTVTVRGLLHTRGACRRPVEMSSVCREVEALALPHPGVSFSLRDDATGTILLEVPRCRTLAERYLALLHARGGAGGVVRPLSGRRGSVRVRGLLTDDGQRWVFVNRRAVAHGLLHRHVSRLLEVQQRAASGDAASASRPGFVLLVRLPSDQCEVTCEPDADRVQFADWQRVLAAVERALSSAEPGAEVPASASAAPGPGSSDQSRGVPLLPVAGCFIDMAEARRGRKVARPRAAEAAPTAPAEAQPARETRQTEPERDSSVSEPETVLGNAGQLKRRLVGDNRGAEKRGEVEFTRSSPAGRTSRMRRRVLSRKSTRKKSKTSSSTSCASASETVFDRSRTQINSTDTRVNEKEHTYRSTQTVPEHRGEIASHSSQRHLPHSTDDLQASDNVATHLSAKVPSRIETAPELAQVHRSSLESLRRTREPSPKSTSPVSNMIHIDALSTPRADARLRPAFPPPLKRPRLELASPPAATEVERPVLPGRARRPLAELFGVLRRPEIPVSEKSGHERDATGGDKGLVSETAQEKRSDSDRVGDDAGNPEKSPNVLSLDGDKDAGSFGLGEVWNNTRRPESGSSELERGPGVYPIQSVVEVPCENMDLVCLDRVQRPKSTILQTSVSAERFGGAQQTDALDHGCNRSFVLDPRIWMPAVRSDANLVSSRDPVVADKIVFNAENYPPTRHPWFPSEETRLLATTAHIDDRVLRKYRIRGQPFSSSESSAFTSVMPGALRPVYTPFTDVPMWISPAVKHSAWEAANHTSVSESNLQSSMTVRNDPPSHFLSDLSSRRVFDPESVNVVHASSIQHPRAIRAPPSDAGDCFGTEPALDLRGLRRLDSSFTVRPVPFTFDQANANGSGGESQRDRVVVGSSVGHAGEDSFAVFPAPSREPLLRSGNISSSCDFLAGLAGRNLELSEAERSFALLPVSHGLDLDASTECQSIDKATRRADPVELRLVLPRNRRPVSKTDEIGTTDRPLASGINSNGHFDQSETSALKRPRPHKPSSPGPLLPTQPFSVVASGECVQKVMEREQTRTEQTGVETSPCGDSNVSFISHEPSLELRGADRVFEKSSELSTESLGTDHQADFLATPKAPEPLPSVEDSAHPIAEGMKEGKQHGNSSILPARSSPEPSAFKNGDGHESPNRYRSPQDLTIIPRLRDRKCVRLTQELFIRVSPFFRTSTPHPTVPLGLPNEEKSGRKLGESNIDPGHPTTVTPMMGPVSLGSDHASASPADGQSTGSDVQPSPPDQLQNDSDAETGHTGSVGGDEPSLDSPNTADNPAEALAETSSSSSRGMAKAAAAPGSDDVPAFSNSDASCGSVLCGQITRSDICESGPAGSQETHRPETPTAKLPDSLQNLASETGESAAGVDFVNCPGVGVVAGDMTGASSGSAVKAFCSERHCAGDEVANAENQCASSSHEESRVGSAVNVAFDITDDLVQSNKLESRFAPAGDVNTDGIRGESAMVLPSTEFSLRTGNLQDTALSSSESLRNYKKYTSTADVELHGKPHESHSSDDSISNGQAVAVSGFERQIEFSGHRIASELDAFGNAGKDVYREVTDHALGQIPQFYKDTGSLRPRWGDVQSSEFSTSDESLPPGQGHASTPEKVTAATLQSRRNSSGSTDSVVTPDQSRLPGISPVPVAERVISRLGALASAVDTEPEYTSAPGKDEPPAGCDTGVASTASSASPQQQYVGALAHFDTAQMQHTSTVVSTCVAIPAPPAPSASGQPSDVSDDLVPHVSPPPPPVPRSVWHRFTDPAGRRVFVNPVTGHTSLQTPPGPVQEGSDPLPAIPAEHPVRRPSHPLRPMVVNMTESPHWRFPARRRMLMLTHDFSPFLPRGRLQLPTQLPQLSPQLPQLSTQLPHLPTQLLRQIPERPQVAAPSAASNQMISGDAGNSLLLGDCAADRDVQHAASACAEAVAASPEREDVVAAPERVVLMNCRGGEEPSCPQSALTSAGSPPGAVQQSAAVVLRPRPCTVTSSLLRQARLLRQVDSKFIVVVSRGLLLMVDQHAASERVRLESLLSEARAQGGGIVPEALPSPLELVLPAKTVLPLTECPGAATRLGFVLDKLQESDPGDPDRPAAQSDYQVALRVQAVPACLLSRGDLGWTAARTAEIVSQLADQLTTSRGAAAAMPAALTDVYNSLACHSAVRFGDRLSGEQCQRLLSDLVCCRLPLQCAHGRPSVIPLADLTRLPTRHQDCRPSLRKLRGLLSKGAR